MAALAQSHTTNPGPSSEAAVESNGTRGWVVTFREEVLLCPRSDGQAQERSQHLEEEQEQVAKALTRGLPTGCLCAPLCWRSGRTGWGGLA
jgi:hypothetical protein